MIGCNNAQTTKGFLSRMLVRPRATTVIWVAANGFAEGRNETLEPVELLAWLFIGFFS